MCWFTLLLGLIFINGSFSYSRLSRRSVSDCMRRWLRVLVWRRDMRGGSVRPIDRNDACADAAASSADDAKRHRVLGGMAWFCRVVSSRRDGLRRDDDAFGPGSRG
jgi:hypothetical protein